MSRIKWSQKGEKINMYFDEESQVITSIAPSGIYYQTENGLQFFHHERLDDSDVSNLNDFIRYLSVDKEIKLININENSIEVEIDGQPILLTEYVAFSKNSSHDLYLSTPSMYHLELNDEEWVELVLQQKDVLFKNMDWDFAYPGGINLEEEAMERLASGKGSNIDIDDISSKALIEMTELDKDVSGYDYVLKISQDNKEYIAFINAEEFDLLQTRILTEKALVEDCSGTMSALEFINYGKLVIKKDETGLVLIDSDFIDTNDNEYFGKVKFMPSVISEGSSFNVIVEIDGLQTCYPITADSEFISDSDISFSNGVSENLAQYIEEPQKNTERINCTIVDLDYNANNNRINGIVNMLNVEMQISGIPDSFDFESKTISIKGINYPVDIDDAKWKAIVQKFKENNLIQSKNCGELVQIPQIEKDKLVYALAIRDSDNNLFGINDERILKLDEKAGYSIIKEEDCLRILYLKEIAAQPFNVSKIDDITLIDTANKVIVSKDGIIRLTNDSMEEFLSKGNELLKKMQKQGDLIVSNHAMNCACSSALNPARSAWICS